MFFSSIIIYINIVLLIAIFAVIIVLIVLAIRALKKYMRSKPDEKVIQSDSPVNPSNSDNNKNKKPLGDILKELRVKNNMTQEFVAESLSITRQAVSKWESGNSSPSMANLISLSKLYKTSLEDIVKNMEN